MNKATRWITFLALIVSVGLLNGPAVLAAGPSATECLENPDLEGCPSSGTNEGESESSPEGIQAQQSNKETSLVWNIIKLVFVLLLVLALIYGLLKFFNQKNKIFHRNRTMENLGGMNLGPNRSIQAVRIGRQVFILGVGESVEIITEITDEKTKSSLLNQDEQHGPVPALGISNWLKKRQKNEKVPEQASTVQFQHLFENQLEDMKRKRNSGIKGEQEDQDNE